MRYTEPYGVPWLARGWERPAPKPEPMMHYDFPLRRGMIVDLVLPLHLTRTDADRINAFIGMLPFKQVTA